MSDEGRRLSSDFAAAAAWEKVPTGGPAHQTGLGRMTSWCHGGALAGCTLTGRGASARPAMVFCTTILLHASLWYNHP